MIDFVRVITCIIELELSDCMRENEIRHPHTAQRQSVIYNNNKKKKRKNLGKSNRDESRNRMRDRDRGRKKERKSERMEE